MKMRFLIPAVFAVATLSAAKAEAQVACSTDDVLFGGVAATACYGSFIGNDVPNNAASIEAWFELVAGGDWGVIAKSDDVGQTYFGAGAANAGSSGSFTLNDPISGTFGLSIKEGRFYSAYLWVGAASGNSFEFDTPNGQGLSHTTLWDDEGDFVIVPEPSSFAMMFLGLAGLGVAARRRRNV